MESRLGVLPGFKYRRAAAKFLCEKVSEIFTRSGVVALKKSENSGGTSRDDLQSTTSYIFILLAEIQ